MVHPGNERTYDLVVIGGGPAGAAAAREAVSHGVGVALVTPRRRLEQGGSAGSAIPSKTLRAAILEVGGPSGRPSHDGSAGSRAELDMDDIRWRAARVARHEAEVADAELAAAGVDVLDGTARFVRPHELVATAADGGTSLLRASRIVIAVGSRPQRPAAVDFGGRVVVTADDVLDLRTIPARLTVVGAGLVGIEYASMFAALGVRVTVVEQSPDLLPIVDRDIVQAFAAHLADLRVDLRLGVDARAVSRDAYGSAFTTLGDGERIASAAVLWAGGREAATDQLDLQAAGLTAGPAGLLPVDATYRTQQDHVFAVGDAVAASTLAPRSAAQGRAAAAAALDLAPPAEPAPAPFTVHTIPQIAMVGATEARLDGDGVAHVRGLARFSDTARGLLAGDRHGLLKLLVAPDHRLLGAHVFGAAAGEIIHLAEAVMSLDGTVDYLAHAAYTYPSFHEAYRLAARDALSRVASRPSVGA